MDPRSQRRIDRKGSRAAASCLCGGLCVRVVVVVVVVVVIVVVVVHSRILYLPVCDRKRERRESVRGCAFARRD